MIDIVIIVYCAAKNDEPGSVQITAAAVLTKHRGIGWKLGGTGTDNCSGRQGDLLVVVSFSSE